MPTSIARSAGSSSASIRSSANWRVAGVVPADLVGAIEAREREHPQELGARRRRELLEALAEMMLEVHEVVHATEAYLQARVGTSSPGS